MAENQLHDKGILARSVGPSSSTKERHPRIVKSSQDRHKRETLELAERAGFEHALRRAHASVWRNAGKKLSFKNSGLLFHEQVTRQWLRLSFLMVTSSLSAKPRRSGA